MLEVNSNPLVTAYPIKGFPETWTSLMDLVMTIQTRPADLTQPLVPDVFDYRGWQLVHNEQLTANRPYNSCAVFSSLVDPHIEAQHPLKTTEEIQSELVRGQKDDDLIQDDLDREKMQVGGVKIEPWAPLDDPEAAVRSVPWSIRRKFEFNCSSKLPGSTYDRQSCLLAGGTVDETPVHILTSSKPGPLVLIIAGLHGNEGAGVVASRHVAKYWTIASGIVVVVERANARGVRVNSRLVPGSGVDLNRAFPLQHDPTSSMAKVLWELVSTLKPNVLMDLHEGRGFFAAVRLYILKASSQ